MALGLDLEHSYEVKDVGRNLHMTCGTYLIPRQLQHALRTAKLELSLEKSRHSVEIVAKDEDIRKLRVKQCLLQDEVGDLHEQLDEEQARSDELEAALDNALMELDEQKAAHESAQKEIRTQSREIAGLRVGHLHASAFARSISADCCPGRT